MAGRSTKNSAKNALQQQQQQTKITDVGSSTPATVLSPLHINAEGNSAVNSAEVLKVMEERIVKRLTEVICQQVQALHTAFEQKFNATLEALCSDVNSLRVEVKNLQGKYDSLKICLDDTQRLARLSDVVIRGIPYVNTIHPAEVVRKISAVIGHSLSPHVDAFRLGKKNDSNDSSSSNHRKSSSYPIIVRFSCHNEQKSFLTLLKSYGRLKLRDINCGFSSDGPINIYESLSSSNSSLMRAALRMRHSGILSSVFTKNGFVFVKLAKEDAAVKIINQDQLISLSPDNKS